MVTGVADERSPSPRRRRLGTVGSALVRLIDRHGNDLAVRTGRPITVAGVSARDRKRDRGIDVSRAAWFDDPVDAGARSRHRRLRRADRRRRGGGGGLGRGGARRRQACRHRQQGAPRRARRRAGAAWPRRRASASISRRRSAGGIPIIKTLRESLAGNTVTRIYGILNGTCELHPDPDGAGGPLLRGLPRGGAAARLCRGRSDLRHRRPRRRPQAGAAHRHRLRHRDRRRDDLCRGHLLDPTADIEAADELGYRIKLLGVASRTDSGIEQRVHPAMVPKSSAIAQDRRRDQCGRGRGRFRRPAASCRGPGQAATPPPPR